LSRLRVALDYLSAVRGSSAVRHPELHVARNPGTDGIFRDSTVTRRNLTSSEMGKRRLEGQENQSLGGGDGDSD